jgi:hypothetical protein
MTRKGRRRQVGEVRNTGTRRWWIRTGAAVAAAAAIAAGIIVYNQSSSRPTGPLPVHLPPVSGSYLGVYTPTAPRTYTGVTAFRNATGTRPDVVMYYSGWYQSFPAAFARKVASEGAVPLVQMDPENISVEAIASGHYDGYLTSYAEAVRHYHDPVIVSFGHEMNGDWYSWGYKRTSPATFIAAWRHIVSLFRAAGARNVTWLWTVNIIDDPHYGKIPSPARWWPGGTYVTWVGIDGYYYHPSTVFSSLFGPTIAAVRQITGAPILIAETAAVPAAGQPAKIADLFAGVRLYGLLGFVWFDVTHPENWRLSSPEALAAFRRGARDYRRAAPGSS